MICVFLLTGLINKKCLLTYTDPNKAQKVIFSEKNTNLVAVSLQSHNQNYLPETSWIIFNKELN